MKKIKKYKEILLIIIFICAIMNVKKIIYATNNVVDYKAVSYTVTGPITVDPYQYSIWTDAIRFHIDANGYEKKYGDNCTNNFLIYDSSLSNDRKAKGYGQYTYKLKALKEFIEYCYTQNQSHTDSSATIPGDTENDRCDYTKLINLSQSTLSGKSRQFMTTFWDEMLKLGDIFNEYQDSYFFKTNTLKAIEKIQGTLNSEGLEAGGLTIRNLSNNKKSNAYAGQSSSEYLTLLTTYMYSINREEKLASVGKGDLVPFLYYAEHSGDTNPYEIGKYAYIALMNEFLKTSGTNYWQAEFDYVYFNGTGFTDRELYEGEGRYDLETLEEWYDETYEKYKNDRGAKQNPLIGSDPDTIISSNYTISYQVEAMKNYVQDIYAELGIDMNVNDFIAKNELMAKYMMESSKLDDTIKDYNVSIRFIDENLQRGTYFEENTTTAVLSDMQVLTFDYTLDGDGHSDRNGDTDRGDGLSDKTELGNISKVDITGFVEKMCLSKYGRNLSQCEAEIDEIVVYNGYNPDIPNSGHVIKEKDASGNIKVYYRVYDYTSNPMLIDTDFDGINDNNDSSKKDNNFKGNTGKIGNIEYNNDFRYFYINNKKYNDELSTMSLMMCNLANGESINTNQANGNISEYLTKIGFSDTNRRTKNTFTINDTETINGRLYLAKKTIQTGACSVADRRYKDVYGIFLGKFDSIDNYKKLITNFNDEEIRTYYENIVTDCINFIRANRVATTNDYCYWICGYGLSGAIAAEIANELVKDGEVYCYTFGATSGNSSSGVNREIKNVINEDDLIPKLNNHNEGFGRSGIIVNDSIYDNFIVEYKQIIGSDKYEAKHKRANSLKQLIMNARDNNDEDYKNIVVDALAKTLCNYSFTLNPFTIIKNPNLFFTLNANLKKIKQGHEIKSYYVLSKSIDGYAENNSNSTWGYLDLDFDAIEEKYEPSENIDLVNTIKDLGVWYVNHVATYQNKSTSSNATNPAKEYYSHRDEYPVDVNGNRLTDDDSETVVIQIGSKKGYFYEPFKDKETANQGRNYYKRYLGNDCSGLFQGVVYTLSEGDRGQTGNVNTASDGLYNHNVAAFKLVDGSDHTDEAMLKLGWEKFYLHTDNKWYRKRKYGGQTEIKKLVDITGYEMSELGVDFLRPGDLLCCNTHVEFYVGYDYNIIYNGIEDVNGNINRDISYGIESIIIDNKAHQGYSTFGWGGVHNTYPGESNYFIFNNNCFNWYRLVGSSNEAVRHTDDNGNVKRYTTIWRKN